MDVDGFVDVAEYVNSRLFSPGEFLCHAPEDASTAALAFPGCPCSPINSTERGACPAGQFSTGLDIRPHDPAMAESEKGQRKSVLTPQQIPVEVEVWCMMPDTVDEAAVCRIHVFACG